MGGYNYILCSYHMPLHKPSQPWEAFITSGGAMAVTSTTINGDSDCGGRLHDGYY